VTEYGYSDAGFSVGGQLYHIRITDSEDKLTYIALDAFGNRTKTLYPSGDFEEYRYLADGQMTAKAVWDASGARQWIEYSYDPYGRIADANDPDGTVHYDYDGFGRRMQVTDSRNTSDRIGGSGTISWEHDALGRVTKVVDQDGWQVVYSWRGDGQRIAIRVLESDDLATMYHAAYLYDKAGRLEYVKEPLLGETYENISSFTYDDNGNRETLTYYPAGNPVAVGYGYNDDNYLTSYGTTGGPYHALTRTVDGMGRSVTLAETQTRQNGQSLALNWAYVYDLRSQICSVAGTVDGVLWGGSYQYRKDGNIDQQTVQGTQTVFGYSGDRMTQRGQQDLGWDGNGQLTSDEVRTLAWTWDGQLRSASNAGGEIRCRYDPDGNRIRREVQATGQPTQARKYIVDAEGDVPQVLLEINPAVEDPNVAIVRTFLYVDTQLVGFHDGFYGDSLYFALSDQHGSVRQVMDESGTVVNGYAYDPWGSPLAAPAFEAVGNPIRYAGYWWDAEIGRYYCWARYYDPLLERFLSRDPQSGSFMEPYELHRYLYCLNDPINRLDPDGEFSFGDITVGSGVRYALSGTNAYCMYPPARHSRAGRGGREPGPRSFRLSVG
jgi:RHS repeat-associated protein